MAPPRAALTVGLAWLASVPLLRGEPDGRIGSHVGEPAPDLELEDLGGRTIADGDGRPVWVNFWATSCAPCRTEMPAMQRLAEMQPDELLNLGVDWDPGLETYYRWAGTDGLPRHYFIGAEGTVLREVIGPLEPARMMAILEELLDSSAASPEG